MKSTTLIKIAIVGAVLVGAGVGTWAIIERLEDSTLHTLVGAAAVLTVVVVVGLLFIGYGLVQAYVTRRLLAQDDLGDLKQMSMLVRMMGNKPPNVNVKLPEQQPWPMLLQGPQQAQGQQWDFDGAYRDTTANAEIEIE